MAHRIEWSVRAEMLVRRGGGMLMELNSFERWCIHKNGHKNEAVMGYDVNAIEGQSNSEIGERTVNLACLDLYIMRINLSAAAISVCSSFVHCLVADKRDTKGRSCL